MPATALRNGRSLLGWQGGQDSLDLSPAKAGSAGGFGLNPRLAPWGYLLLPATRAVPCKLDSIPQAYAWGYRLLPATRAVPCKLDSIPQACVWGFLLLPAARAAGELSVQQVQRISESAVQEVSESASCR